MLTENLTKLWPDACNEDFGSIAADLGATKGRSNMDQARFQTCRQASQRGRVPSVLDPGVLRIGGADLGGQEAF